MNSVDGEGQMSLKGKHALVTGSSRGIGRGIALKLAENGVKVGIHYVQNEEAAKNTLAEVRKRGGDGFIVQADVLKPEEIKNMFKRVADEFGGLDAVINNAGESTEPAAAIQSCTGNASRRVRFAVPGIWRRRGADAPALPHRD